MKINVTLRVICVLVVLLALDGVSNKQEEQIDISEVSMPIVEEDESDSRKDILRFLEAIALFETIFSYRSLNFISKIFFIKGLGTPFKILKYIYLFD